MASGSGSSVMGPSFIGYIGSTKDALLIIQAVSDNRLLAVSRRPHDKERNELIQSGSVFVFIEEKSGIKRWTDGVAWSPSRILGRFLVYRELDRNGVSSARQEKHQTALDKKLLKKSKRKSIDDAASMDSEHSAENLSGATIPDRSLVGSLIASYAFKEYGLIKKTMSLTISKNDINSSTNEPVLETVHLVSYYRAEDVLNGRLLRPVNSGELKDVQLSNELWNAVKESSLGGKIPIEDEAFYFMDQSNPNAIALGFNPSIHLQPQYQQQSHPLPQHSMNFNPLPPPLKQSSSISLHQSNDSFNPSNNYHQPYQPPFGQQPQFTQLQNPQSQQLHHYPMPAQVHHHQGSTVSLPENDYLPNESQSQFPPTLKFNNGNFISSTYAQNSQTAQQNSISSTSSNPAAVHNDSPASPPKVKSEGSPILQSNLITSYTTPQYNLSAATPRNNMGVLPTNNGSHHIPAPPFEMGSGSSFGSIQPSIGTSNNGGPHNFAPPFSFGSSTNPAISSTNPLYPNNASSTTSVYQNLNNGASNIGGVTFPNVYTSNSNYQTGLNQNSGKIFYDENNQMGNFVGGSQFPHYASGPN